MERDEDRILSLTLSVYGAQRTSKDQSVKEAVTSHGEPSLQFRKVGRRNTNRKRERA